MSLINNFKGAGVALVTPFLENGTVDYQALENLVEHVIKGGVDYLVCLGTTAETPTLTPAEKQKIIHFIGSKVNGRLPIVAGIGGNSTAEQIETIKQTDFSYINAILSVTPYYNKPTQEGLCGHFSEIARHSPVPIVLYNIPARCGVNMTAETTVRLAKQHKNIVAVKEASGDLCQVADIIQSKPDGFEVISGDDMLALPFIALGGVGVISVFANAFPKEISALISAASKGEFQKAQKAYYELHDACKLLFIDGNPPGIKSFLSQMGLAKNILRLPLVPVTDTTSERIKEAIIKLQA